MRTSNFDTDEADILLGDPNFSAVRYVDRLLPNESSLTDLSKITKNLQVRQDKLNDTIKDCLHSYSVLGDASEAVVVTTKRSIIKLSCNYLNNKCDFCILQFCQYFRLVLQLWCKFQHILWRDNKYYVVVNIILNKNLLLFLLPKYCFALLSSNFR